MTYEESVKIFAISTSDTTMFKGPNTKPEVTVYVAIAGISPQLIESRLRAVYEQEASSMSFPINRIQVCDSDFVIKNILREGFELDVKKACKRLKQHTWSASFDKKRLYK